ncbi:hypothetical protein BDZ90DRAFT_280110 [Jaminaea rosea]|uniref:PH domain-containing protein n=1 Tax=Jaminaea rosea TaxID=1569628 RepID=A0A316UQE5_9BASI|nr:hypothetical protein BDZ90DRAFT_280110 [Jaminaea rosea]PWN27194.1 hypothetical protein BDZ90DRAFT_280110 [Jaminaea rosea]
MASYLDVQQHPASDSTASDSHHPHSLRTQGDPHAHQPFRRYYLGPSPVSLQHASRVAAALRQDDETTDPIGIAIAGREGFVLLRGPAEEDEEEGEDTVGGQRLGESSKAPHTRRQPSFHSDIIANSSSRTRSSRWAMRRDPSAASAVSFASAASMPADTSSRNDSRLLARSSTPPGGRSSRKASGIRREGSAMASLGADLPDAGSRVASTSLAVPSDSRRLSFDMSASGKGKGRADSSSSVPGQPSQAVAAWRRAHKGLPMSSTPFDVTLDDAYQGRDHPGPIHLQVPSDEPVSPRDKRLTLRGVPSIQSLTPSQRSSRQSLRGEYAKKGCQDPQSSATHPTESSEAKTGGILNMHRMQGSSEAEATKDSQQQQTRSTSVAHFTTPRRHPQRDVSTASRLHGGHSHERETSRYSRMSRASTAQTLGSNFSSATGRFAASLGAGSFGASGGFRARIVRVFKPSAFVSRETPADSPDKLRQRGASAAELAGKVKETRRRWKGGVAPGQVGTSAGGTKWVGQSFEVGSRFWDVVEHREREVKAVMLDRERDEKRRGSAGGESSLSHRRRVSAGAPDVIIEEPPEDAAREDGPRRGEMDGPRSLHRTPSAVLNQFAKDASMMQDQRQEQKEGSEDGGDGHQRWLNRQQRRDREAKVSDGGKSEGEADKTLTSNGNASSGASMKALHPSQPAAPASPPQSPTKTKVSDSPIPRRTAVRESPRPKSLIMPKQQPTSPTTNTESAVGIEARHGWSDVASMMSKHSSSIQSSGKVAKGIKDRAEQRLREATRSFDRKVGPKSGGGSKDASARPTFKRGPSTIGEEHSGVMDQSTSIAAARENVPQLKLEDLASPPPPAGASAPLETSKTGWESAKDYFVDAEPGQEEATEASAGSRAQLGEPIVLSPRTLSQDSEEDAAPRRMTLQEATTHPEPPLSADEKYPETTFQLLRKPSDQALRSPAIKGEASADTASDHAVVMNLTSSPTSHASPTSFANGDTFGGFGHKARTMSSSAPQAPSVIGSDTPLLRGKVSTNSIVVHDARPAGAFGSPGSHGGLAPPTVGMNGKVANGDAGETRKTVQFDKLLPRPTFKSSTSSPLLQPPNGGAAGNSSIGGGGGILALRQRRPGDSAPAPPEEVLSREYTASSASPSPNTERPHLSFLSPRHEAPSASQQPADAEEEWLTRRSILRRDRMLVKNDWIPNETLPQDLDETIVRKFNVHPGEWREYIVVLRMGRVELWSDPSKTSRLSGHSHRLHLSFVIPLSRGSTYLSMFSHVDRIFCLTYSQHFAATHISGGGKHRMLNLRKSGTNILLFDARGISVAADWVWDLWREVGGLIPETLEVHIPVLDLRIKFPIPEEMPADEADEVTQQVACGEGELALTNGTHRGGGEGYTLINRAHLSRTILRMLKGVPEWEEPLQIALKRGARFELAWRRGLTLDWVIHDTTLDNQPRDWSVLCGSVLKEARQPALLEFRAASHYPTTVLMPDGKKMAEPPGLEGFLWRVKPVSGALTRLYVSTHDYQAFVLKASKAFPPDRHIAVGVESSAAYEQGVGGNSRISGSRPLSRSRSASYLGGGYGYSDESGADGQRRGSANSARRASGVLSGPQSRPPRTRAGRKRARDDTAGALRQHVLDTIASVASTADEVAAQMEAYRAFERRRQFDQISNADGFIDVKSIYAIRYLGATDEEGHTRKPGLDPPVSMPMPMPTPQENAPDDEPDLGGEEGLNIAMANGGDRTALRRARQFEVVMTNGRSTRFEAYSRSVAKEWVARMHDLSVYWKRREKVDALELMEVSGCDPALIRRRKEQDNHHAGGALASHSTPIDNATRALLLGNIWHWCSIAGCRGIIHSGHLFVKPRPLSPFRSRFYLLVSGRLLSFKLLTSTRTARGRQNAGIFYKRQENEAKIIPLRDSYVWTGKLTEQEVGAAGRSEGAGSLGQFASGGATDTGGNGEGYGAFGGGNAGGGGRHKVPRMYSDGLLSVDEDEDCTFVIRYRPVRAGNQPADPVATPLARKAEEAKEKGVAHGEKGAPPPTEGEDGGRVQRDEGQQSSSSTPSTAPIPSLSDSSHTTLVMRARSKMERDLWVRAIAHERERLMREEEGGMREVRMRAKGETPWRGN